MVNAYHSDGVIKAVVGTVVYYFCEEDSNVRSVMIGDSIRVCEDYGDWSGLNPMCITENELDNHWEHIEDINKNKLQLDSSEEY